MNKHIKHLNLVKSLIGPYINVFIAYATDSNIRYHSASGGVATALIRYLLENDRVEVVLMPKLRFKHGLAYGIWDVISDPKEICKHSGSIYTPTFGFSKVLTYALNKFRRIAITTLPCQAKAVKKLLNAQRLDRDIFIIGLYCNNTPSILATKYALNVFSIRIEDVESISYRGRGWPGYTTIKTKNATICVPFPLFWDSGFGQYFYERGCYLCNDQTNSSADLSFADPWTLPYESIRKLGGATLVVVRSEKGLKFLEDAISSGYIAAIEIDPIYAIEHTTLLKSSKKVLRRILREWKLPPSFTTIMHELTYSLGHVLASREKLWPLLRLYHRIIVPPLFIATSILDYKLKTTWAKMNDYITLIQNMKIPKNTLLIHKCAKNMKR
jgi:coenzyme F420 hydrogenase subunit beta